MASNSRVVLSGPVLRNSSSTIDMTARMFGCGRRGCFADFGCGQWSRQVISFDSCHHSKWANSSGKEKFETDDVMGSRKTASEYRFSNETRLFKKSVGRSLPLPIVFRRRRGQVHCPLARTLQLLSRSASLYSRYPFPVFPPVQFKSQPGVAGTKKAGWMKHHYR
uniref:Uncharacterized protein n=1 Tax=Candidatus Kentrum sp. LFY TaxID=2126342 RepID=A0A450V6L4_9GAMM|nr:MAG: hypothetical protein BECKLFY1418B_GA0070995_11822 [Candidatus Kentron sp. LFY]